MTGATRDTAGWAVPTAVRVLALAVVGGVLALAIWLTAGSLRWPLVHDGPIMHYAAARILEGAVPYRDLFDMNFPGTYVAHVLALRLLGAGEGAFRAFDLVLLGGALAGLALLLWRSYGALAVAAATGLFWLYHLAGGAWRAGQRDLMLCVPLAWTMAAALAHVSRDDTRSLALAGLGLGTAAWIKPHALLLAPALVWLAWSSPRGQGRARRVGVLALGLVAPAVPTLAWLAAVGGLGAFADIVGGYLLPLYSHVGRTALLPVLRGWDLGVVLLAATGLWVGGGLATLWRAGALDRRAALLAVGVAYGVLHFVLQGKGWTYHLYPLALFAAAVGAAGLGAALRASRPAAATALLVALAAMGADLGVKGTLNLAPTWIAESRDRAHAVAAALRLVVGAGDTVQVLDTTAGGVHALYLLGLRQPTRFLYDFPFYHDVESAYVRGLREELLAGLRDTPPAAVVLFERGWPAGGYERLAAFPDLDAWLRAGYRLAVEGSGYRVYARRPPGSDSWRRPFMKLAWSRGSCRRAGPPGPRPSPVPRLPRPGGRDRPRKGSHFPAAREAPPGATRARIPPGFTNMPR